MTISFSGLASGLDTSSWIKSLTALKQAKVTVLEEEKEQVLLSQETLNSIKTFFNSFRATIEKITDSKFNIPTMDLFAQNLAISANLDVLTATATHEAVEGKYEVKVDKLATNTNAVSGFKYTTTITETTMATLDSKLVDLGASAGNILVNVKSAGGIQRGVQIAENETIGTFITKLGAIGVNAHFNETTGIFSIDAGANDITDIGNTNIVNALHLSGVNEGYKSNTLEVKKVETVFEKADEDTTLGQLGVTNGSITIETNDVAYDIDLATDDTLGELLTALRLNGIDASLEDGLFKIENAKITADSANFVNSFGMSEETAERSQVSNNLTYRTTVVEVTEADLSTKLSDLGAGTVVNAGDTVIVKNSNNEYHTITLGAESTLGDLMTGLSNAGLSAQVKNDGTIEITGGTITGGTFDAIEALSLNSDPYTAYVTGNALTETIETFELVTLDTRLVDDLGVSEGYLEVTDSEGDIRHLKIYSGQTIQNLMADLASFGIDAELEEDTGILKITGGAFETLTDADVNALISAGTIVEPDDRYKHGTNLLTLLYGSESINLNQTEIAQTYARSRALYQQVTNVVLATEDSTLAQLDAMDYYTDLPTGNSDAVFNVRGTLVTVAIADTMTVGELVSAINAQGIEAEFDSLTGLLTVNNATLESCPLAGVLNMETSIAGKYVTSDAVFATQTVIINATETTTLGYLGLADGVTETIKIYDSQDNYVNADFNVNSESTIGDIINAINTSGSGAHAYIENGKLKIENGKIENAAIEELLGLEKTFSGVSHVLGTSLTIETTYAITGESTLGNIIDTMGTGSFVQGGYTLTFNGHNMTVGANTTINEVINQVYDLGGTAQVDASGRLHINDGVLDGTVAQALGFSSKTVTLGVAATGATMTTDTTVSADLNTTFKDLHIADESTVNIYNSLGSVIATVTIDEEDSLASFFETLHQNDIEATISDGVISLYSVKGNYITGDIATALGIGVATNTLGVNTNQTSTISLKQTITEIAKEEDKLSDIITKLGATALDKVSGGYTLTFNGDSLLVNANTTLGEVMEQIRDKGGTAFIDTAGRLQVTGGTLTGSVADALGIVSKTVILGVSATGDTLKAEQKVFADLDTTFAQLGFPSGDSTTIVRDNNGNQLGIITVAQTDTLGSFFNKLAEYDIKATISNGIISLSSVSGKYIEGNGIASNLGIGYEVDTNGIVSTTQTSNAAVTYSVETVADRNTKLSTAINKLGNIEEVSTANGGYNLTFRGQTVNVSAGTTLGDVIDQINTLGGYAELDNEGRLKVSDGELSGTVAVALGFVSTTIPAGITATGNTLTIATTERATTETKFQEILTDVNATTPLTMTVNDSMGRAIGTITVQGSDSIEILFGKLEDYGINASISDGIITLSSTAMNSVVGDLAEKLGIGVETTTAHVGMTQVSAGMTTNQTLIADNSTTLAELGVGDGFTLEICDPITTDVVYTKTFASATDTTISDVINWINSNAGCANFVLFQNGVLTINPDTPYYIKTPENGIADKLGINTVEVPGSTIASTTSSTVQVTYTITGVPSLDTQLQYCIDGYISNDTRQLTNPNLTTYYKDIASKTLAQLGLVEDGSMGTIVVGTTTITALSTTLFGALCNNILPGKGVRLELVNGNLQMEQTSNGAEIPKSNISGDLWEKLDAFFWNPEEQSSITIYQGGTVDEILNINLHAAIWELVTLLNNNGVECTYNPNTGRIEFIDNGYYATGKILTALGIETTTEVSSTVTVGQNVTSTIPLTYTYTELATEDTKLVDLGATAVVQRMFGIGSNNVMFDEEATLGSVVTWLHEQEIDAEIENGYIEIKDNEASTSAKQFTGGLATVLGLNSYTSGIKETDGLSTSTAVVSYTMTVFATTTTDATFDSTLSQAGIPSSLEIFVDKTGLIGSDKFIQDVEHIDTSGFYSLSSVSSSTECYGKTFKVSTTEDLQKIAQLSRDGSSDRSLDNTTFVLANDIDMYGTFFDGIQGFGGTFDGNGYTIKNLTVSATNVTALGLFNSTVSGAEIKNLGLEDVYIYGEADGQSVARCYGGIVGSASGATTIKNCYVEGRISVDYSGSSYAGGILGYSSSSVTIESCWTDVATEDGTYVGGIAGFSNVATITNCAAIIGASFYKNAGTSSGISYNASTVDNCYVFAKTNNLIPTLTYAIGSNNVYGYTSNYIHEAFDRPTAASTVDNVAFTLDDTNGRVGTVSASYYRDNNLTLDAFMHAIGAENAKIVNGVLTFEVAGVHTGTGVVDTYYKSTEPINYSSTMTTSTTLGELGITSNVTINQTGGKIKDNGFIEEINRIDTTSFEELSSVAGIVGGHTYKISTTESFVMLMQGFSSRMSCDACGRPADPGYCSYCGYEDIHPCTFILANDIDFEGAVVDLQEEGFTGILEGNGYAVKNVEVYSSTSNSGLFYDISGAKIKNLGVENILVTGSSDVQYAGGIAGRVVYESTIENCYVTGSFESPDMGIGGGTGGIVGDAYNCDIRDCWTNVEADASGYFGGIAGRLSGTEGVIRESYAFIDNDCGSNSAGIVYDLDADSYVDNCYVGGSGYVSHVISACTVMNGDGNEYSGDLNFTDDGSFNMSESYYFDIVNIENMTVSEFASAIGATNVTIDADGIRFKSSNNLVSDAIVGEYTQYSFTLTPSQSIYIGTVKYTLNEETTLRQLGIPEIANTTVTLADGSTYTITLDESIVGAFNNMDGKVTAWVEDGKLYLDTKAGCSIKSASFLGDLNLANGHYTHDSKQLYATITGTGTTTTSYEQLTVTYETANANTTLGELGLLTAGETTTIGQVGLMRQVNTIDTSGMLSVKEVYDGDVTLQSGASYKISTTDDLIALRDLVNAGRLTKTDLTFVLANDIDMSGVTDFSGIYEFTGTFNGNGYAIKNMSIRNDGSSGNIGLFCNTNNANILNLAVVNADVMNEESYESGILIGLASGTTSISNCFVSGKVYDYYAGGLIGNASGNVQIDRTCVKAEAVSDNAGGFIAYASSCQVRVIGSVFAGYVESTAGTSGFLVGESGSNTIQLEGLLIYDEMDCPETYLVGYNTGTSITGTLASYTSLSNTGTASVTVSPLHEYQGINIATLSSESTLGDLLDVLEANGYQATLKNGVIDIDGANYTLTGDLIDKLGLDERKYTPASPDGTMSSTEAVKSNQSRNITLDSTMAEIGIAGEIAYINDGVASSNNNFITIISGQTSGTAISSVSSFTRGSVYTISTKEDLQKFASIVNSKTTEHTCQQCGHVMVGNPPATCPSCKSSSYIYTNNSGYGCTFVLTADIDMSGEDWEPIGVDSTNSFQGTFNGNGYAIKNLTSDGSAGTCLGLFGFVSSGTIKNVALVDAHLVGDSDDTTIGGIVGYASGGSTTILNCYVTGYLEGNNSNTTIGGIVGLMNESYTTHSWSNVATKGGMYVGGITGFGRFCGVNFCEAYLDKGFGIDASTTVGGISGFNETYITSCYVGATEGFDQSILSWTMGKSNYISGCNKSTNLANKNDYANNVTTLATTTTLRIRDAFVLNGDMTLEDMFAKIGANNVNIGNSSTTTPIYFDLEPTKYFDLSSNGKLGALSPGSATNVHKRFYFRVPKDSKTINTNTTFADINLKTPDATEIVVRNMETGESTTYSFGPNDKIRDSLNSITGLSATLDNGIITLDPSAGYEIVSVANGLVSNLKLNVAQNNGDSNKLWTKKETTVTKDITLADYGVTSNGSWTIVNSETGAEEGVFEYSTTDGFNIVLETICDDYGFSLTFDANGKATLVQDGTGSYIKTSDSDKLWDALFGTGINADDCVTEVAGSVTGTMVHTKDLVASVPYSLNPSSKFKELKPGFDNETQTLVVHEFSTGEKKTITITGDNSVQDLIDALAGYGISARVENNKFYIDDTNTDNGNYVYSISNGIKEALKLGDLSFEESEDDHYNTSDGLLYVSGNMPLFEDSLLSSIPEFKAGTLKIFKDNVEDPIVISVTNADTISDFFTEIAQHGIEGVIYPEGKIALFGKGNTYIVDGDGDTGSNLMSKLGFTTEGWKPYGQVFEMNTNSKTLKIDTTVAPTGATTLGTLEANGLNFSANDKVNLIVETTSPEGDNTVPLEFTRAHTLDDVFYELSKIGINASIDSSGRIIMSSSSYTNFEFSGALGEFLMGSYVVETNGNSIVNVSDALKDTDSDAPIDTNTKLTSINGLNTGKIKVQKADGTATTVEITNAMTLGDFFTEIAKHGLVGTVNNGKVSIVGVGDVYLEAADSEASNIIEKLKLSNVTKNTGDVHYNTNSTQHKETVTVAATGSTQLKDVINHSGKVMHYDLEITKKSKAGDETVTITTLTGTSSLNDLFDALAEHGINAYMGTDGKLRFDSATLTDFSFGGTLGNFLNLANKEYNEVTTNSTSTNLSSTTEVSIDGRVVLETLGVTNGALKVHKTDGTYEPITIDKTKTIADFFTQIAKYGLNGTIGDDGIITISGVGDVYLEAVTDGSNIIEKLGLAVPERNTTVVTSNTNSNKQTDISTGAANGSTQLGMLNGISNYVLEISTKSNAGDQNVTITFSATNTLNDVFDKLAEYGISASIGADGRITMNGEDLKDFTIGGGLGDFLMAGYEGTKVYDKVTTNNVSTNLRYTVVENMNDETKLSDLGVTNANGFELEINDVLHTISLNTTATIGELRDLLSTYGIHSEIINGKLSLTADGIVRLRDKSGTDIITDLGLGDMIGGNVGQESTRLGDIKTNNLPATMQTKIAELKDNNENSLGISDGEIYVYQDGTRHLVNIDINDTLETLAAKLSQYGITMGIAQNGQIYFDGNNNSYLTTDGLTSATSSNILQKLNIESWQTRYNSTSEVLDHEKENDIGVSGDTKLVELRDADGNLLGINTGEYAVYSNGVRTTETITDETTVDDFIATMATYGMIAQVDSSGQINVGAYNNTYLATSAGAGTYTNAIDVLFDEWNFVNIYTSNNLEIPEDVTVAISRTTKLADINRDADNDGVNDYEDGYITVVHNGVQTNISLTADDTVGTLMDELALYGFDCVINDAGQLIVKNTGNSILQNYSGTDKASNALDILGVNLDKWITTNLYTGQAIDVIKETEKDAAADRDTKLSKLGITTGEYNIYSNGVKYTALISSDETVGSFLDTLATFGIQANIVDNGTFSVLQLQGNGDSYIAKTTSTVNQSNVVDVLFPPALGDSTYNYRADLQTSTIVTTHTAATEDTLLSALDVTWGNDVLKAEGVLSVTVDGETSYISIGADETVGTLLSKFRMLGLEASINNGELLIQSGHSVFTINSDGTTSSLVPNLALAYHDDLGGYAASSDVVEQTVTWDELVDESVAQYADDTTVMSLLNISSGTLSVYKNGQKATIQVDKDETFGELRSRVATALSGVDIKFENGYLTFYSTAGDSVEVGATTDTSNFSAICGLTNDKSGTVKSARQLYRVNGDSVVTSADLFRKSDVTEGTFIIGNATFTIEGTTTLSNIISQINASDEANATAQWDSIDGKLVITSRTTGSAFINIEAGTSNFTDVMGLTSSTWTNTDNDGDGFNDLEVTKILVDAQQIGDNAQFSINGTHFTSTSNTITSDLSRIQGLTINLKGVTAEGGSTTLTVERDKETLANAVSDIVDAYNELIENVDKEVARGAQLADQSTLKMIRNQIRSLMTSSLSGMSVFKNLDSIGISADKASANNIATDKVNVLNFDKDKFLSAFDADRTALKQLLVGTDTNLGVFSRIENVLESALTGVSGYFESANKSYQNEISRLDKKIQKANKEVERYKARLEAKFSAMDLLIAKMQNQYSSFLV